MFDKLRKKASPAQPPPDEHSVIVHFDYGSTDLAPMFALEDRLRSAIDQAGVGEHDGHEIAIDGSDGFFYMYGPDADALFAVARPVLESAPFMKGARAKLRYGPPQGDAREVEIVLGVDGQP